MGWMSPAGEELDDHDDIFGKFPEDIKTSRQHQYFELPFERVEKSKISAWDDHEHGHKSTEE